MYPEDMEEKMEGRKTRKGKWEGRRDEYSRACYVLKECVWGSRDDYRKLEADVRV